MWILGVSHISIFLIRKHEYEISFCTRAYEYSLVNLRISLNTFHGTGNSDLKKKNTLKIYQCKITKAPIYWLLIILINVLISIVSVTKVQTLAHLNQLLAWNQLTLNIQCINYTLNISYIPVYKLYTGKGHII